MSNVYSVYHVVFATKSRKCTIPDDAREVVHRYMTQVVQQKSNCRVIRVNSYRNHVHILLSLHPTVALSQIVQDIKGLSSGFLRRMPQFAAFEGWGIGYFASSVSPSHQTYIASYIQEQDTHHGTKHFDDELAQLIASSGMILHDSDYR